MDHELHNHHGKPVSHVRPVKQESYDAPRLPTGTTSFHHHHSSYDNFDQSNWYDRETPMDRALPSQLTSYPNTYMYGSTPMEEPRWCRWIRMSSITCLPQRLTNWPTCSFEKCFTKTPRVAHGMLLVLCAMLLATFPRWLATALRPTLTWS